MALNIVGLSGNVTRDPELKQTRGGTSYLAIGLAVPDARQNASGEWEEVPNFFDVMVYGKRAEALSRYVRKGMRLTVGGRLRWSSWKDQNQGIHTKVDVVATEVVLPPKPKAQAREPQADLYGEEVPF